MSREIALGYRETDPATVLSAEPPVTIPEIASIRAELCPLMEEEAEAKGLEAFGKFARMGAAAFRERYQAVPGCIVVANRGMLETEYSAVVAADLPDGWIAKIVHAS